MKREAEVKELLINNTIHLIAIGGFEAATVKEITKSGGKSYLITGRTKEDM